MVSLPFPHKVVCTPPEIKLILIYEFFFLFVLKITRITSVANSIRVTKNEPFGRAKYRSFRSEQKQIDVYIQLLQYEKFKLQIFPHKAYNIFFKSKEFIK